MLSDPVRHLVRALERHEDFLDKIDRNWRTEGILVRDWSRRKLDRTCTYLYKVFAGFNLSNSAWKRALRCYGRRANRG